MGVRRTKGSKKKPAIKRTTRALPVGARLKCVDNSGAKTVEVVSVSTHKTKRRQIPSVTLGEMFTGAVKSGSPEMRHKLVKAIVVRMAKEFRRVDGTRVLYEDNACVVVDNDGNPKGSDIKGVISKDAVERWPTIGKVARMVL